MVAAMKITPHKHLFNGDCNYLFSGDRHFPPIAPEPKHPAQWLHDHIDLIADSGIDTYLINAGGQMPWYPSKVVPNFRYKRGDREFFRGHYPKPDGVDFTEEMLEKHIDRMARIIDRYLDLEEAGINWVAELAKACRRRGISPWVTVRMNDGHGGNNWDTSFMNCALQKDPKYRLSGRRLNPKDGVAYEWQLLDYKHREVRDYYFTMIKELIEDYDFDGLELDWLRSAFCLEPTASQENIDTMTDWFAEIRALCRARAQKTGKPYYMGLRMPPRLGLLKAIGIDVKEMARRDVIDFVAVGNFWQANWDIPFDALHADLGENVSVLGNMDSAPNWLSVGPNEHITSFRLLPQCAPLLRGNAANKLALGADGLEYFNFFACGNDPENEKAYYAALNGLADLENLRGKPKQYALSTIYGWWGPPVFEHAEQIPATLEPEWRKAFRISMCAEPTDKNLKLTIQVIVEKKENLPDLGVSFNGSWPKFEFTPTTDLLFPVWKYNRVHSDHIALNYAFDVGLIKEGWNEIILYNENHNRAMPEERAANSVHVASIELSVA